MGQVLGRVRPQPALARCCCSGRSAAPVLQGFGIHHDVQIEAAHTQESWSQRHGRWFSTGLIPLARIKGGQRVEDHSEARSNGIPLGEIMLQ